MLAQGLAGRVTGKAGPALAFAIEVHGNIRQWVKPGCADGVVSEQVVAAFADRLVALVDSLKHARKVRHLDVDFDAGVLQSPCEDLGHRVNWSELRRTEKNDRLPLVASLGEQCLGLRDVDLAVGLRPDFSSIDCAAHAERVADRPLAVFASDCGHHFLLVNQECNRLPRAHIIEGR